MNTERSKTLVNPSSFASTEQSVIQPKVPKSDSDSKLPDLHKIGCLGKITSFKETDDGRYLID